MNKATLLPALLTILFLFVFTYAVLAQAPPPPPTEKGTASNKAPGGGAPLNEGIYVVLAVVAGFGAWKSYSALKKSRSASE